MTRFGSAREAKEFLVARIAEEAQREGVPLSEVERKMLYFTETAWTLPDIMEVNDQFDREYDQEEYEKKIAGLIRNSRKRARIEDKQEFDDWSEAIRILRKEDHYLLVMDGQAGIRPPGDLLKLLATALAIIGGFLVLAYLADRFGIDLGRGSALWFLAWAILACAALIYLLLHMFLGRERAQGLLDKVFGFFLGTK